MTTTLRFYDGDSKAGLLVMRSKMEEMKDFYSSKFVVVGLSGETCKLTYYDKGIMSGDILT